MERLCKGATGKSCSRNLPDSVCPGELCFFTRAGVCAVSTDSSRQRESSRGKLQGDAGFSHVASLGTAAHLGGHWDF